MSMKKGVSGASSPTKPALVQVPLPMHAQTRKKPVKQGFFGIFEVFADTIVICTLTAFCHPVRRRSGSCGEAAGAERPFSDSPPPTAAGFPFLQPFAMCCFAFSTIIGWDYTVHGASVFVFLTHYQSLHDRLLSGRSLGATMDLKGCSGASPKL